MGLEASKDSGSESGLRDLGTDVLGRRLNLVRLKECMTHMPSISQMRTVAEGGKQKLKEYLDKLDLLLYPLLQWIITGNRCHLRMLAPKERMLGMHTPYQFILLSSSPEKEFLFQKDKKEAAEKKGRGSIWAFHGSNITSWHSILHTGLRNMSNTKYMSAGAAYGPGIYMALQSSVSIGYCGDGPGWKRSMFGPKYYCLALCEVINHPDLTPPNPYYVVPNEDWVTTRFLFILRPEEVASYLNVEISSLEPTIPALGWEA